MRSDQARAGRLARATDLEALGWAPFFDNHFEPHHARGLTPARVAVGYGASYRLYTADGEIDARLAGRLRHKTTGPDERPVVGDWVAVALQADAARGTIQAVLPRRTRFSRKVAGQATAEQVIAANVDTVLLVNGLDGDFNPRRIERYLVVAWESGARPLVVLSKADLCPDLPSRLATVESIAVGVPVLAISAVGGQGLDELAAHLAPGQTFALLGSSGAGKSTLLNLLAGREVMRTAAVRARDSRGRHTTTHRELVRLPSGALAIDTPGLREFQLWEAADGHRAAFDDVASLAEGCRFRDCTHQGEPGCAIQRALLDGSLSEDRLESYRKLDRELRHLEIRLDKRAERAQRQQHKTIHKLMRNYRPRG